MGWRWHNDDKDDDAISSSRGFSDLANSDSRDSAEERSFSTRRIVKSSCRTEEVEPGRFVRKCDKTEQILRDSIGRPAEVVESKTEHTEDDVTDEVISGRHHSESSGVDSFSIPGLRSSNDIMQGFFGDLGRHFFETAEEMANGIFQETAEDMRNRMNQFFNIPSRHRGESAAYGRSFPEYRQNENDGSKQMEDSPPYSGLAGEVTDV